MELMNQVVAVGSDLDWKYHAIACPSIYFANCAVSGE
jgi:predicted Zn-dependent protease